MVKFGYAIQYVDNVQAAVDFYVAALGLEAIFVTPEGDYGELSTGSTTLAFASSALAESHLPDGFVKSDAGDRPLGVEFAFVVDDVAAVVERACSHGATLTAAPAEKPWGQTVAYVRDLNGFLLEICTAVEGGQ